jgi:hypothetical protein
MRPVYIPVIIYFFIANISVSPLYSSVERTSTVLFDQKDILKLSEAKAIDKALMYSVCKSDGKIIVVYLTDEKKIVSSIFIQTAEGLNRNVQKTIYSYEKEDELIYLDVFAYRDKYYIAHLEKYTFKVLLTSVDKQGNTDTSTLGNTSIAPYIFCDHGYLYCFLLNKDTSTVLYKKWDLLGKRSTAVSTSGKNVIAFSVVYGSGSGNLSMIWKQKDDEKKLYISPMNRYLFAYAPTAALKFNQAAELPEAVIDDQKMNMIIRSNYKYKFFTYDLGGNIKRSKLLDIDIFEESVTSYTVLDLTNMMDTNIIVLKKIYQEKSVESIYYDLVFFNKNLSNYFVIPLEVQAQGGELEAFRFVEIDNGTIVFWMNKNGAAAEIMYSNITW